MQCGTSVTSVERSALHEQVSLAAVNQIYVIHEAKSEDSLKACFENVNISLNVIRQSSQTLLTF